MTHQVLPRVTGNAAALEPGDDARYAISLASSSCVRRRFGRAAARVPRHGGSRAPEEARQKEGHVGVQEEVPQPLNRC